MRVSSKAKAAKAPLFANLAAAITAAATPAATPATDKAADKAAERAERVAARAVAATGYNGSSLAVRSGTGKLATLLGNIKLPKQRTDAVSQRDRSYLRTLRTTYAAHVNTSTGEFNPVASGLDAGVASHLGHHGLAIVRDGVAVLTPAGLELLATA